MIENDLLRWLFSLLGVAVVGGAVVTYVWYAVLCWLLGIPRKLPVWPSRPLTETGSLTGIVERVFFAVAVATGMSGTVIAMVAWTGIKHSILWPSFTVGRSSAQGPSAF